MSYSNIEFLFKINLIFLNLIELFYLTIFFILHVSRLRSSILPEKAIRQRASLGLTDPPEMPLVQGVQEWLPEQLHVLWRIR